MTLQETQKAFWREGQRGGAPGGDWVPGAGGHRVLVLRVGDSSALAGDTATTTAGGCHRWAPQAALGGASTARHPQNSSQPCREGSAQPKWPEGAGGEPCGCHKPGVTRLGSIHQCAAVVKQC